MKKDETQKKGHEDTHSHSYLPIHNSVTDFYIHVPLCVKKCHYCNFTSFHSTDNRISQYLSGIEKELAGFKPKNTPRTLHVGGGTPNILRGKNAVSFISCLQNAELTHPAEEFAVELNPELVDRDYVRFLTLEGVTRLSLGVQSLNEKKLRFLGRIHDSDTAVEAFKSCRASHAKSVSVDFIFALPKEDEKTLRKDLENILSLSPDHVSAYALTIENGCRLFDDLQKNRFKPPEDDKFLSLFTLTGKILKDAGYERYETSNFRKYFSARSVHNSHVWSGKNYLGFGPASVSRIGNIRSKNVTDLLLYSKGKIITESEEVTEQQRRLEILMTGLRTKGGIRLGVFSNFERNKIEGLIEKKLISVTKTRCLVTEEGVPLVDEITALLSTMI
ncbi:radical SAM family heme chaperone HemW [candidate division WOR-3 bacterium]|nr:radical SAM family heme chaperone HemW [candidate division WOR-3 bacterium]